MKKKHVKHLNSAFKIKPLVCNNYILKSHTRTNLGARHKKNQFADKTDEELKTIMNLGALYKLGQYVNEIAKTCSEDELTVLEKILDFAETEADKY